MEITKEELKFWAVLALAFFVGLGFAVISVRLPEALHIRRAMSLSVGEALMVAAFLGLTVDVYVKKRLILNASRDVYEYLVGYHLPEEIKARLQALMGTALIRRNWQIAYRLSPLESGEVLIDVNYSFELENISNDVQRYTQKVQIDKHLNPRILELRCDDPDTKFRLVANNSEGSLGKDQPGVPGVIEASAPEIKVQPSSGTLRYPFRGHYELRTPHDHSDTFSFTHPSVGVTITVESAPGYEFSIEPETDTVATENMWQFRRRAFLRSEHIKVRWFKSENQNSSSGIVQT